MRTTPGRMTRRDALGRLAATGVALAWSAPGRGAADVAEKRPPARIYISMSRRPGEGEAGPRGILAVDPRDGTWTQVAPAPFIHARVAPDGRGFLCTRNGRPGGLWAGGGEGGAPPRRIAPESVYGFWSPDGQHIAFTDRAGDLDSTRSWRIDRDGTGRVELPLPDGDAIVDWSPDGEWLLTRWLKAEGADRAQGKFPHGLVHPDGTGRRLLLPPDRATGFHRVSPDGRTVVFTSYDWSPGKGAQAPYRVERIGVDGQGRRILLEQDGREGPYRAVWSPDGKELAVLYLNNRREEGEDVATRLVVVDTEGKRSRRLGVLDGAAFSLDDWR